MSARLWVILTLFFALIGTASAASLDSPWPQYGGGAEGTRHVGATHIHRGNVERLSETWRFQTGDAVTDPAPSHFKATPILVAGHLIVISGHNRVYALDPGTGELAWRYDPQVDFTRGFSEMFTSRGVTSWVDDRPAAKCRARIFVGTLDARLIALDAESGLPCTEFGTAGQVDLSRDVPQYRAGEYSVTSPAVVVGDVVVVGSSIGDNGGARLDYGLVRAFDVRSGRLRWTFDPLPRTSDAPGADSWARGHAGRTGAANVWTTMAGDAERDLVFLPTSSPSPDFYGGERLGDGRYANSLVALRASTGEFVWARQLVHHDLWDYDLASQPMLVDITGPEGPRAVVALATKMGFVYVLDRNTGTPLHPLEERPVPRSEVRGEQSAPTQPFPSLQLHSTAPDDFIRWSYDAEHEARCDRMLGGVRFEGIFTPPSVQGTLLYPGNAGGSNWGSMAYDPTRTLAYVAVNRIPTVVTLIPRAKFRAAARRGDVNGVAAQFTAQSGTPFGMSRYEVYDRETGLPCHRGPWATLAAVDLATASVAWEVPLGRAPQTQDTTRSVPEWGYFAAGGPLSLAGGLVFVATPHDHTLRAFDADTGETLWSEALPAAAHATPMAYEWAGRQFVVIAAGGQRGDGKGRGDLLLAFTVPKPSRDASGMTSSE
ncbi:MAG: PQQ-binding-like beta-propeller repeat protein [Pseudomonadota bacterium]